ncbi:MAG: hypothetical protein ACRD3J_29495 [Thermoanaerobaculia bacterium]
MTNAEKLQKKMDEVSRKYENLPEYLKRDSARPQSASIYRTVRPTSDTKKS